MSRTSSNVISFSDGKSGVPSGSKASKALVARILRPNYIGEIIRDRLGSDPLFHWVVQRSDSGEVLALGQARTLSEAEAATSLFLDDLRLRRAI